MPPLAWALLPLSWLAALLRESCRGGGVGAREGKRANGKRGNNAILNDFIDGLISVTE